MPNLTHLTTAHVVNRITRTHQVTAVIAPARSHFVTAVIATVSTQVPNVIVVEAERPEVVVEGSDVVITAVTGPPGPVGPVGGQGPAGAAGTAGTAGTSGINGSTWYEGSGVPGAGTGVNGDFYLNDANGDVYLKAAGAWSVVANIQGLQGTQGTQGAQGNAGAAGATGATGVGIVWRGTWSSGTAYVINDGVTWEGSAYIAVANSTAQTPSLTPPFTYWEPFAVGGEGLVGAQGPQGAAGPAGSTGAQGVAGLGVVWRGSWSPTTAYVINDAIAYAGSSYIAILGGTNFAPPNATYWDELALKGAGIPVGGTTGQVLAKLSGTDYDVGWLTLAGGGFGGLDGGAAATIFVDTVDGGNAATTSFDSTVDGGDANDF